MNLNFKEGSTWFITETINSLTCKSDWHITSPTLSPPHHTLKKGIDHQLEGAWSLKKFSLSALLEIYGDHYGVYQYWWSGLKGQWSQVVCLSAWLESDEA